MDDDERDERIVRLEAKLEALDRLTQEQRTLDKDAAELARTALEVRLERMNEFRKLVEEQQATFMPRAEYDVHHDQLVEIVTQHRKQDDNNFVRIDRELGTQRGLRAAIYYVALPILIAILGTFVVHTLAG